MRKTVKQQILTNGFNEVMKHHMCGNYIDMSDIEGLENSDILWDIDLDRYRIVAYTELGLFKYKYDFDFDFDENLDSFVDALREFLYNQLV